MKRRALKLAALVVLAVAGYTSVPLFAGFAWSEWATPDAFTTPAAAESAIWLPAAWEPNVVYESDLCFTFTEQLDTIIGDPMIWQDGPDDEWRIRYWDGPSGYTSGGALTGFTPTMHISDDISAASLDFLGTGCAMEGRQDPAAQPEGQGVGGGNGPPGPILDFVNVPGAAASYTKIFVLVEYVLESASLPFGVNEYVDATGGTKLFRLLCNGCLGNPNGMIVDWISGTIYASNGTGSVAGCSSLQPANVWPEWPSHAGDAFVSSNPCFDGMGDEGWPNGVTIRFFACLDADPDHDGDPSDGDMSVTSWGFDEAEGIMGYWEPADMTGADAGAIIGFFNDQTWGGGGSRPYAFSRWLTYVKIWHGDGTGVSCTVPPIAPWT